MQLECIVTLASPEVRLRFIALERSLRETGCNLPLLVIPYNEGRFHLPANAEWWWDAELAAWLKFHKAHPAMIKCQCLAIANFQFVDADIIFLRNPSEVLKPLEGFVTSCGHWRNPDHAVTTESLPLLTRNSTMWQKSIFNSGQWACDRALFTRESLRQRCETPEFQKTCLTFHNCDQSGINLLVNSTDVPVNNLTLPPWNMQSTWAGDYPADYRHYWKTMEETPYLIHWAGINMAEQRPINGLLEQFLSPEERVEWRQQIKADDQKRKARKNSVRSRLQRIKRAFRAFHMALNES